MLDHVVILLAEDDENDIFLMGRAMKSLGIPNRMQVVRNGKAVIDYLAGEGGYADREKYPMPGLLLLDLRLPWMDGFDVLAWLRGRPQFNQLPVVVLTSSKLQKDVDRSRQLGVYDYRVKPQAYGDLVKLLDDVRKCWLDERSNQFAAGWTSGSRDGGVNPSGY